MSGVRGSPGISQEAHSWDKSLSSIWCLEKGRVQGRNWPSKTPSSPLFNSFLLIFDGHLRERKKAAHLAGMAR